MLPQKWSSDPFVAAQETVETWRPLTGEPIFKLLGMDPFYSKMNIIMQFAAHVVDPRSNIEVRACVTSWGESNLRGYVSWLARSGPRSYQIFYDEGYIKNRHSYQRQLDARDILRSALETAKQLPHDDAIVCTNLLKARIFLHEIGHLALHKATLWQTDRTMSRSNCCDAKQEDEAWRYAIAVTAIALGDFAKNAKRQDPTWVYA